MENLRDTLEAVVSCNQLNEYNCILMLLLQYIAKYLTLSN